ncbi:MAG: hypothetical protein WCP68_16910 [Enhydrobacter sp.]
MGRFLIALMLFVLAVPASAQQRVQGLDRVPIVVKDIRRARLDFAALGFTVKSDRPHDADVESSYIKFPDGSALELVSPISSADSLSSRYVDWLRDGDGPISLGLYRPGSTNAPPPGVFFGDRQRSPTDMLEDFQHDNAAVGLSGIWLAGSPSEPKLANLPGAKVVNGTFCMPFGFGSKSVQFQEGEILMLPESAQVVSGRPIVAVTVKVQSLAITYGYLDGRGKKYRQVTGCGRQSLWVEGRGLWLEFIER